jgi:alpha-ketoglutarate-dependent taurine dioxygenase
MMRLEDADGSWLSWDMSQQLLLELFQPVVAPGRAIVHNWKPGELVFWDNRCTLHSVTPTNFYHNRSDRLMHRISLVSAYVPEAKLMAHKL